MANPVFDRHYSAVIFDLDGTLVDSAPDLHVAVNAMLSEFDLAPLSLPCVAGFVGNGVGMLVRRCLEASGGEQGLQAAALESFSRHYARAPAALSQLYAGAGDALARLGALGMVIGLCTNKAQHFTEAVIESLGIAHRFDAVVGGTAELPAKPDPAMLLECIRRMGVRTDTTLYVGDSEIDWETAQRANVRFALFTGGYRQNELDYFKSATLFDDFTVLARALTAL